MHSISDDNVVKQMIVKSLETDNLYNIGTSLYTGHTVSNSWIPVYAKDYWFNQTIKQEIDGLKDFVNDILPDIILFKSNYWWRGLKEEIDLFKSQEDTKDYQAFMFPIVNEMSKLTKNRTN